MSVSAGQPTFSHYFEMKTPDLDTTHHLQFEVAPWYMPEFKRFRIGTCEGLWKSTKKSYVILAITNGVQHNGHLDDVFEWFEYSCKRDKRSLVILELWNGAFQEHLISKRGFRIHQGNSVIKNP